MVVVAGVGVAGTRWGVRVLDGAEETEGACCAGGGDAD